jgi:hypothetical protein
MHTCRQSGRGCEWCGCGSDAVNQNAIHSIDEIQGKADLPPWSAETSEPVVFTAQGPIPFSAAPVLIQAAVDKDRIKKLERLVKLLTDWNARSEEITSLRRELNL